MSEPRARKVCPNDESQIGIMPFDRFCWKCGAELETRGVLVCPGCGKEVGKADHYCPACGKALP